MHVEASKKILLMFSLRSMAWTIYKLYDTCICFIFSDPPLEEDDVPPGEWICHRCRVAPKQDVAVSFPIITFKI